MRSLVARGLSGVKLVTRNAPSRFEERRCGASGRSLLAEDSGSLHEECPLAGAQGSPADGGGDHPHRLRPTRCKERQPAVAKRLSGLPTSVCEAFGRERGSPHREASRTGGSPQIPPVTKARLILVPVLASALATPEAPVAYPGRPNLPGV